MRSRNIKPAFFINEDMADLDPKARLLYIGLWCYADKEGLFEWRPKRIKAAIFPYDNFDIDKLLMSLHAMSFIVKYLHETTEYGFIPAFLKHQRPHPHEKKSVLPKPQQNQCHDMSLQCHDMSVKCTSDTIIEDTIIEEPHQRIDELAFDYWMTVMDKKGNTIFTDKRKKAVKARLAEGYTLEDIKAAIDGCKISKHHSGGNDTGTIYNDLELICRSGEKLEGFRDNVGSSKNNNNGYSSGWVG